MRHGDYACALLWRDGLLLLGRRSATRKTYPNAWDVIGGRVEDGETLAQALMRELGEEIGIRPTSFRRLQTIDEPRPQVNGEARYHVFVVDRWDGGEPTMRGTEHVELRWLTVDEACGLETLAMPEYRAMFRLV